MSYISEDDYKKSKQFYYGCLVTAINHINKSSSISELNYYTLEACRLIVKLNELNEDRIHTDDLNAGGV